MEGLLPFLYRAIILHYVQGGWQTPTGDSPFFHGDSPSASRYYYVRLAGGGDDSARLRFAPASPDSHGAFL